MIKNECKPGSCNNTCCNSNGINLNELTKLENNLKLLMKEVVSIKEIIVSNHNQNNSIQNHVDSINSINSSSNNIIKKSQSEYGTLMPNSAPLSSQPFNSSLLHFDQQDILTLTSISQNSPVLVSSGGNHGNHLSNYSITKSRSNTHIPKLKLGNGVNGNSNSMIGGGINYKERVKKWVDETVKQVSSKDNPDSKKIKLDVGGKYFATTLSTLTKYPDSMLCAMFSNRFQLPLDEDGRIFIDRDGKLFSYILSFLRDGPLWVPPENLELRKRLETEFGYYGLSKLSTTSPIVNSPSNTPRCVCSLKKSINSGVELYNLNDNQYHQGVWKEVSDFSPSIRSFRMLVSMGLYIYAITERTAGTGNGIGVGGNVVTSNLGATTGGGQFQFEEYSPVLNTWTVKCPILDTMSSYYLVSVVVEDSIYAIPDAGLRQPIFRYDSADSKWYATDAVLPTGRTSFALASMGEYIYVMGGYKGSTPTDSVERYHPKSNSWCQVASMNSKRAEFSATVIDDSIYVMGGSSPNTSVEKYNPHSNQWQLVCNLSNGRFIMTASSVLDEKIYAIGSENDSEGMKIVLQYSPATNLWKRVAPIIYNSYYTNSAISIDRFIYFIPWNSSTVHRYEACQADID